MRYFDHDTDACKDELVQALRIECGGAAVDAYWTVLECIYREETDLVLGENLPGTKSVTHWLCIGWDELKRYFGAMGEIGLLVVSENGDGTFTLHSERAQANIESYQKRCETARENGKKGGRKPKSNRTETKSVPTANREQTKPKTKEKEKEKLLESHKGFPNNCAPGVADADVTAPPAAECSVPVCPLCSQPVRFDASDFTWRCNLCGDVKEPRYEAVLNG